MKTLLITAFEPFGGESENPSALALGLLPETIGGIRLEKRLLEAICCERGIRNRP